MYSNMKPSVEEKETLGAFVSANLYELRSPDGSRSDAIKLNNDLNTYVISFVKYNPHRI